MRPQITTMDHATGKETIRDMTDEEIAEIRMTFPDAFGEVASE